MKNQHSLVISHHAQVGHYVIDGRVDGEHVCSMLANVKDGHAHIAEIAVFDGFRGRGYGEKLMRYLLDDPSFGVASASLIVLEDNDVARALYAKLGFKVDYTIQNYCLSANGLVLIRNFHAESEAANE